MQSLASLGRLRRDASLRIPGELDQLCSVVAAVGDPAVVGAFAEWWSVGTRVGRSAATRVVGFGRRRVDGPPPAGSERERYDRVVARRDGEDSGVVGIVVVRAQADQVVVVRASAVLPMLEVVDLHESGRGAAGVGAAAVAVLGLTSDGRVRAAGDDTCGQCDVAAWTDIVAIAAGSRHTVGIRPDGTAIAAGCNDDGQCDVGTWAGLRPG
ncbi:hypothetical protein BN11_3630006 [Nostocoides australiense Ben110]|uniref:Uncharacterized protein n=1 Tax=Nostocoides australiense Ben110 TaxID=1193182 RepID=W6JZ28_9MICO|nr:hypothetical protein BN11_3630006 [Tetrasphaera australiensis Ben110]